MLIHTKCMIHTINLKSALIKLPKEMAMMMILVKDLGGLLWRRSSSFYIVWGGLRRELRRQDRREERSCTKRTLGEAAGRGAGRSWSRWVSDQTGRPLPSREWSSQLLGQGWSLSIKACRPHQPGDKYFFLNFLPDFSSLCRCTTLMPPVLSFSHFRTLQR